MYSLSDFVQSNKKGQFSSLSSENLITDNFSDLIDNFTLDTRKLYRDLHFCYHCYHLLHFCYFISLVSLSLSFYLTHILSFVFALICISCLYLHLFPFHRFSYYTPLYFSYFIFPIIFYKVSLFVQLRSGNRVFYEIIWKNMMYPNSHR